LEIHTEFLYLILTGFLICTKQITRVRDFELPLSSFVKVACNVENGMFDSRCQEPCNIVNVVCYSGII
tara:strand:+ start:368 stop:571 length:204 start_codon:yes stop_codon:yes gene_type:complete